MHRGPALPCPVLTNCILSRPPSFISPPSPRLTLLYLLYPFPFSITPQAPHGLSRLHHRPFPLYSTPPPPSFPRLTPFICNPLFIFHCTRPPMVIPGYVIVPLNLEKKIAAGKAPVVDQQLRWNLDIGADLPERLHSIR